MAGENIDILLPELRAFAAAHRITDEQLRSWVAEDEGFPNTYRQTHGVANDATYLKLVNYYVSRRIAGDTFAQANGATAQALDTSAVIYRNSDITAGDQVAKG